MDTFSLIAHYLSGSCSPEEAARLESWRKASAANDAEFRKMEKVWAAAAPATFCPDAGLAWQKVQQRLCSRPAAMELNRKEQQKSPRRWFQLAWPVAAAVSLLALSLLVYFFLVKQENFVPSGLSQTETGYQEKQLLQLADGTQVWLNQQSSLYYPAHFDSSRREVYLKGEAFFEVSHQPEKPFIVYTKNSRVQVLGTSFNLQEGAQTRLQVKTGRVEFSSRKTGDKTASAPSSLLLSAGEAALLEESGLRKESPPANFLSWKTGRFDFTDTPLAEVFRLLEQYYPLNITTDNPALLECRLNARFEKQSIEEVLEVIALTFGLEYQLIGKEATFKGNAGNCRPAL